MNPAAPHNIMRSIGFTLYLCDAMNTDINIIILVIMPYVSVPKFSPFISTSAAEASNPTTPGRNPLNTAATDGCF